MTLHPVFETPYNELSTVFRNLGLATLEETRIIKTALAGHSVRFGFLDCLAGICYKIWEAIKTIFGCSDWQQAEQACQAIVRRITHFEPLIFTMQQFLAEEVAQQVVQVAPLSLWQRTVFWAVNTFAEDPKAAIVPSEFVIRARPLAVQAVETMMRESTLANDPLNRMLAEYNRILEQVNASNSTHQLVTAVNQLFRCIQTPQITHVIQRNFIGLCKALRTLLQTTERQRTAGATEEQVDAAASQAVCAQLEAIHCLRHGSTHIAAQNLSTIDRLISV